MGINIVKDKYGTWAYDNERIKEKIKENRLKQRIYRLTGKSRLPRNIIESEVFNEKDYKYIHGIAIN